MSDPVRHDALVIGAGLAGMAAGIRLAQAGLRACVLERHALWGGLNSFYKKAGRRYDVGLHALTNYVPKGTRGTPLARLLRQLRIPHDALRLGEQHGSRVVFPDVSLRFSNDFELLRSEVHGAFPAEREGFDRLAAELADTPYDEVVAGRSAREGLARYLRDPLLVDLLLHPLLWYGSPTPQDLDWNFFVTLWKSIYEEGFCRPRGGVRPLLELIRARMREEGCELRLRTGVRRVLHADGRATGVELDDGSVLEASVVLSSVGWLETLDLCGPELAALGDPGETGQLSFLECCTHLDTPAPQLGLTDTVTFYNLAPRTLYGPPGEGSTDDLYDVRSGVLCAPENYADQEPEREGVARLTVLASPTRWHELPPEEYARRKQEVWETGFGAVTAFAPDVRPHATCVDVFSPRTITHYTGKRAGAVYGAARKRPDARTPLEGLFLIGTDQGTLGIVGAMLSGIGVANRNVIVPRSTAQRA